METIKTLQAIISGRRTVKPGEMNGKQIDNDVLKYALELANWAPNHGSTEPWRFVIYGPATKAKFCSDHAMLYREHADPVKYMENTFNNLSKMGDKASHVVIAWCKRGDLPKIPVVEEVVATGCAVQNLLLGAEALGLAAYWGSGGMTHHKAMKEYLALGEEDMVLGILYFGYCDQVKEGKRKTGIEDKLVWK